MSLTFGSLFSGIDGLGLGFERAGMVCKWQVEINPFCQKVLSKHWPHVRKHDDIRTFDPVGDEWRVDCVAGGDPCQGNSNAGSVYKTKHEDFGIQFIRVVEQLRPRIVVRENPYPSRPDALWTWWRMRNELERLGYAVLPFRLRSCCLGADHRRDRVWLLAERTDANGKRLEGFDRQGFSAGHAGGIGSHRQPGERQDGLPAPRVCRSRNEVPDLVDRLTALGNSIDPTVAQWIGERIMEATC
jgi:DNA (cytosine-5)-methyltransferase 1